MIRFLVIVFLCFPFAGFGQTMLPAGGLIDQDLLNSHILKEVNKLRKKAKVDPLYPDPLLKPAADDHSAWMAEKDKLTHFQNKKIKRTPKNRVDFYGEQFAMVGENVLQNWMRDADGQPYQTYEELAAALVEQWRNSPPHYANMISDNYTTTYTSVHIGPDGKIYACQLFGSDAWTYSYRDSVLSYDYQPSNERRCRKCMDKQLVGDLLVSEDGHIIFSGFAGPLKSFRTKHVKRRLRLNWWTYGVAADVVLKEQYDCDTNIVFNGKTGVRGIPLEPVFKKDFRDKRNVFFWKFIVIDLGQVPEWVDQDYEVNLTLINRRRTCAPVIYNILPAGFEVDLEMNLYLDSLSKYYLVRESDTLVYRINFEKSAIEPADTLMQPLTDFVANHLEDIKSIDVTGFSSIEGSTENNIRLYQARAGVIVEHLVELGFDSSAIKISAQENFRDFRKDITGTDYAYLSTKTDAELKEVVNETEQALILEPILKNHRFAEVRIYADRYVQVKYSKEMMYDLYRQYIADENIQGCRRMQSMEYNFALSGEVTADEIRAFEIPRTKQYADLLHDRYLMIYRLDSLNPEARRTYKDSLISLQEIYPKHERTNTSLAILEYEDQPKFWGRSFRKYFKKLQGSANLDKSIKARIVVNAAARHDWAVYRGRVTGDLIFDDVRLYIDDARLNVSETFELASYYAFFEDYHFAYELTKKKVFRSTSRDEIVFFLKLIYYLDESLSAKTVIKYFRRIAKWQGREFCTYFNSPDLNFQILDDPEVREIYCEYCNE